MFHINTSILFIWIIFVLFWYGAILYEIVTKKFRFSAKGAPVISRFAPNILLYIALLLLLTNYGQQYYPFGIYFVPDTVIVADIGLAIGLIGILFAIWARAYLGGNWGGTPVIKKGQTLTKTGPYAIVRNPIYLGITIGVVGSAIIGGTVIGLVAIACIVIFSYFRIRVEEDLLRENFGKEYEEYSRQVKAFIPWVW